MNNLEKYNNVFCETLQIEESQLNGLEYQGVELWDSVGHMTLMAALEDAFDIQFETDDLPIGPSVENTNISVFDHAEIKMVLKRLIDR